MAVDPTDPAEQQLRALKCCEEMRVMASRYRQLGFRHLADHCRDNARQAERWAGKLIKRGMTDVGS